MITSPINPMRYWKLEETQRMLNAIEGYENVVIEFQCQQADGWNKLNWDCTCGIKEPINGKWNWVLKHMFVVEAKTELDAHNLAWQEAAERLVTDVWKNSIDSFRNEQKQASQNTTKNTKLEAWGDYTEEYSTRQKQLHKELVDRKLMDMELENTMVEKIDLTNIQTNNTTNTTWTDSEPVRWIASTTIVATFLYAMYALYKYELILPTFFTFACIWSVASMIILVKESINRLLD
jgi:hypothetical protein